MAALRSRCGHYIFALVVSFFFPGLISAAAKIGCLPYFDTWCGLSANLECSWLETQDQQKNRQKVAIWAPLHNFVRLYLRN